MTMIPPRELRISVVVPAHNARRGIVTLLAALAGQSLPAAGFEVIVVDDGSADGAAEYLRAHHGAVRVLRLPRGGAYRARNAGVRASRGQILAFTDADCDPHPDWLLNGVTAMRQHGLDIAAGGVEVTVADPRSVVQRYDARFNLRQGFYATTAGFGVTANLFVTRAMFDRVGGFDAALYSGGDQRFCQAAIAAGARFGYVEHARIRHPARRLVRELVTKTLRVAHGRARAFPNPGYYVPRLLSTLPEAYRDPHFRTETLAFKLRFILLHYGLEALRVAAYARARLSG